MLQLSRSTALLLLATACGPSVPGEPTVGDIDEHEVLADRCGSTEPVRLLPLAPNEAIELVSLAANAPTTIDPAPTDNGWVFAVTTYDRELTPTTPDQGEDDAPQPVSSRIVWVDGCGDDVRLVAEGSRAFRAPSNDEPWLACSAPSLLAFDPEAGTSQWHPDLQCPLHAVGDAFLTSPWDDDEVLVRARLPIDGPTEIVQLTTRHSVFPPRRVEGSDRFVVLTDAYELLELDARTGAVSLLRTGAHRFEISPDGRFVLWEQVTSPPPPRLLWDRQTDEERPLAPSEWQDDIVFDGIEGNVAFASNQDRGVTELTLLPSGQELILDGIWQGVGQLGEAHVLERTSSSGASSLALLEPGSEIPQTIPHGTLVKWWVHGDRLWTLGVVDDADPSRLGLLELAAPDYDVRVVATDIGYPMRLADGRLLTVLDRDAQDRYGTLVLVDADGSATSIDHDVLVTTTDMAPLPDDVVVYVVRDADDERTGVWAAQIAPISEP